MDSTRIIKQYLKVLGIGNYKEIMKLFSPDAIVHSPLYGEVKASKFYRDLFADTSESKITLLNIFKGKDNFIGAGHFRYEWKLADGTLVSFECVDIFKFSKDNYIKDLTIIYDTAGIKPAFEKMKL